MFAIRFNKKLLKQYRCVCDESKIWVSLDEDDYVTIKDRGLWKTAEEAQMKITDPCEEIVEVTDNK